MTSGLLLVAAIPLVAQTNAEVNAGVQFNFSTPGARSLGLGGAFVALADDATAAYSNPAGLTALSRPEVSIEGRSWSFDHSFTDRGHYLGVPSESGVDTLAGLRTGEQRNSAQGLSFLSLVYPRGQWRFAFYRHELAHFRADYEAQGAFLLGSGRLRPTHNTLRLDIVNFGVAAAFQFSEALSVGVGLSYYDFSLDSQTVRYNLALPLGNTDPGGFAGPPLYTVDNVVNLEDQRGRDRALGVNAGLKWQLADSWSLGGVFRQGPRFDLLTLQQTDPGLRSPSRRPREGDPGVDKVAFSTPYFFGLGLAWQPTELLTLTLDYDRVGYSSLAHSFATPFTSEPGEPSQFRVANANEVHLGAEHIFNVGKLPIAGRVGTWWDPDHRIRFVGPAVTTSALFRSGEGEIHYAAGLGVIFRRGQIDAAFDLSRRLNTVSLSTVFRF